MRIFLAGIPVVLASLLPSASLAELPQFPFVHAAGEATTEVPPDEATIHFTVASFDKESAAGLERLQVQLAKALDVLAAAGVPEERITGFNLNKQVERARDESRTEHEIVGYYFSRSFEVELTNLEKFSSLIAELMALDNLSVIEAEFDIEDRNEVESRLIRQAGENARHKAEEMARNMGVSIESVFAVSEGTFDRLGQLFRVEGNYGDMAVAYMRMSSRDMIFVPDRIEVRKSVNVLFKLREQ